MMTSPQEIQCDTIKAKWYEVENLDGSVVEGEQVLSIDFTRGGRDLGGWPPDYFRSMIIRKQFDDGSIEIGLKPIVGRNEYVGPISAETLDLLESCFDIILEMSSGDCR